MSGCLAYINRTFNAPCLHVVNTSSSLQSRGMIIVVVVMVSVTCVTSGLVDCFDSCSKDYKERLAECSQFDWCKDLVMDLHTSCLDICRSAYKEVVPAPTSTD